MRPPVVTHTINPDPPGTSFAQTCISLYKAQGDVYAARDFAATNYLKQSAVEAALDLMARQKAGVPAGTVTNAPSAGNLTASGGMHATSPCSFRVSRPWRWPSHAPGGSNFSCRRQR
jgi:hypothetical protein